ncbi:hypothetical protein HK097_007346 [Rhizophlyctis rosea]|uniref:SF3 helicase domain-containing protein n=1 Tax=Rhizophlyctis rosea TaxID=64517 RepID=A0AAD5SBT5_9FUNG|nr:hypothetical protein HK097_007346 [Rhizophlyctis rosea]
MKAAIILTTVLAAGANFAAAAPTTTSSPTPSAVPNEARAKGIAEAIAQAIKTSKIPFPQAGVPQPASSGGLHKRCDSDGYWNLLYQQIMASKMVDVKKSPGARTATKGTMTKATATATESSVKTPQEAVKRKKVQKPSSTGLIYGQGQTEKVEAEQVEPSRETPQNYLEQPVLKLEYADEERVKKLLKSPLLGPKDRAMLKGYLKQRKRKNHFVVTYTYRHMGGFGRLYIDVEKVGHQMLSKNIRKYITNGYYLDIDVVNCQPSIILYLFKQFSLNCPDDLKRYVRDRGSVLAENGITDKRIVNKYLNKRSGNMPYPFLKEIHRAIYEDLVPRLKTSAKFSQLWDSVEKSDKKYNKEGSFLSYVVATVENRILHVMEQYFLSHGLEPDSLIFDGMLVKKDDAIDEAFLRGCEEHIKKETGVDLHLAVKPMECEIDFDKNLLLDLSGCVVGEDKELSTLIEQARNGTSGRLAHLAMYLMKKGYICVQRRKWFKFVQHKWCEISGAPSMAAMEILAEAISGWYDAAEDELQRMNAEDERTPEEQYHLENLMKNLKKEKEKRLAAIEDTTVRSKIMKDLEELMDGYTRDIKFDGKPYLLCFTNGVYDLLHDAIRPGLPEDYLTIGVPYALPDMSDPEIEKKLDALLESILPDEDLRDYVLKTLSTCLEGVNRHEQYWTWQGTGRNGKGILKDLMQHTLGEDFCKFPQPTIITSKRCQSSQASPELVDLKGARAVFLSEPCVGEKIKSATLREMTGNDKTRLRGLYGSQETVSPDFTLFLLCNGRPEMDAPDTDAVWNRERGVRFRHKFVESPKMPYERQMDKELKQKLPEYAPYFMVQLLRVYKRYRENGYKLEPPPQVLEVSNEYRLENNPVEKFFKEQIVRVETDCAEVNDGQGSQEMKEDESLLPVCRLWEAFETWRKDEGITVIIPQNAFSQKFSKVSNDSFEKGRYSIDGVRQYAYTGMVIKDYEWDNEKVKWVLKLETAPGQG